MTTGASTSPFARDRRPLPQAVVRGQVRLQPRGHKLLAFRLLQAHPQQLRVIQSRPREAAGAREGRGAWTRWTQNIRGGEKVGHRRQVRRSNDRWRSRWPACGKKQ